MNENIHFVVTPDGGCLPATPENRAHAQNLWNKERAAVVDPRNLMTADLMTADLPKIVNVNDDPEELMTAVAARELKIERETFERERERAQKEQAAALRRGLEDQDRQRAVREQELAEREREMNLHMAQMNLRMRNLDLREKELAEAQARAAQPPVINKPERTDVIIDAAVLDDEELAIGDPAVDIATELVSLMELSENLRSDGKHNFATLGELFEHLWAKYPSLAQCFENSESGSPLVLAVKRFRQTIKNLKKPDDAALAGLTVLALNKCAPSKTAGGLKFALSVDHSLRCQAIVSVEKTGTLPYVSAELALLPVAKQPGVPCCDDADQNILNWKSLCRLVSAYVCYVSGPTRADQLKFAVENYNNLDPRSFVDCDDLFEEDQTRFDVCSSLKGSSVLNDYSRIVQIRMKLPQEVQTEYVDLLAKDQEVTELSMDWITFKNIVRRAWGAAQIKCQMLSIPIGLAPTSANSPHTAPLDASVQPQGIAHLQNSQIPAVDAAQDKAIKCSICSVEFNYPVHQQNLFKSKGYEDPKKCPNCRPPKICDNFRRTGSCSFGDRCKYLHQMDEPPAAKENTAPAASVPAALQSEYDRRIGLGGGNVRFDLRTQPPSILKMKKKDLQP